MVIISTRALDVIIHSVSPESILGGGAAAAGAPAAGAAAPGAASAAGAAGAGAASGAGAACATTTGASGAAPACAWAAPPIISNAAAAATKLRLSHFIVIMSIMSSPRSIVLCSECVVVGFAGPYTDDLVHGGDENLAVADLSCAGIGGDRFNDRVHHFGAHGDFDFDLGKEIYGVFRAAIDFRMSLLAPVALDLTDGHALNAKRRQRFAYFVELERLDDSRDEFHSDPLFGLSSGCAAWAARVCPNQESCRFLQWGKPLIRLQD